ncbi:ParB/RepB/Spo0J family partition protein [Tamlana crocina]
MTTKASTPRKRSSGKTTANKALNGKEALALQVQELPMGKIKPDPGQPRKTFDEKSLSLLSQSIKEHGVLQPITVRESGKGFTIVMGERRYRASKLAGKKTIPCMVRNYGNGDVLEVQIIENLQRKDVEPTEEAEAIAYLHEKHSPGEIAKRLGRTDNFVRQRLKLAGLIDGFKQYVRNGEMTISLGVAVALFEPEEQQMMLEAMDGEFNANRMKRMVEEQTYDLQNAPFDVSDKALAPKADACTDCPFNAANQGNLFGEGKMVCTRSACFESKKSMSLMNLIDRCKKENRLLIPEIRKYWLDDENNRAIVSLLENKGLKVHLLDEVRTIEAPVEPTMGSVRHEHRFYDYTEEELKAKLEEALEAYREQLASYGEAEGNGYTKGILFHPKSYQKREAFVKVIEPSGNEQNISSVPIDKKKMDDCTPKEQIIKMNLRENRKKQIENNRQFEEVAKMIRETDYVDMKKPLSVDEMVAISISLLENNVGYIGEEKYFSDLFEGTAEMTKAETVESFRKNFKKETFHRLLRFMIAKQVHLGEGNHTNDLTNLSFYNAVQRYYGKEIAAIEKEYAEKRDKREARLKERIAVLERKIQEHGD